MSSGKRFNIRVYGIWMLEGRVLVNEETIRNKNYIKFIGGGLEYGEGVINCLHREWKEELNLDIKVLEHFYTTEFFQESYFDESQVISIYYLVEPLHPDPYIINTNPQEYTHWIKVEDITPDTFSLPIDKVVGKKLRERFL
ncbi:MAG: NUDIX hydrolase [Chitinophagales bacterium]|nr:NUDIX hydrolase [Chitinophagales bacterium]